MVQPAHERTGILLVIVFIGFFIFSGCTDNPVDPGLNDGPASLQVPTENIDQGIRGRKVTEWAEKLAKKSSKARYYDLLDRAYIPGAAGKMSAGEDSVRLIVGFSNWSVTADAVLSEVLNKYKILNRFAYKVSINGAAITLPAAQMEGFLAEMEANENVSWTEPDVIVPTETGVGGGTAVAGQHVPWGITNIGANASWTVSGDGTGEVGVDLYIIDSGVSSSDLNVVECLEFSQQSGAQPCSSFDDPGGHGTEVAAIAAAMDNATGIVGVAPGARIHVVKSFSEQENTTLGSLIAVVDFITQRKRQNPSVPIVVNISLGSNVNNYEMNSLDEAIRASIAEGVVYVISAGNSAIDAATVSPAHVPEAITVGAYSQAHTFASFSNFGSVIDILAPGEMITTLTPGGELVTSSGTSFSAPYVAGAAALLLADNPSLSPAEVRDLLVANSRANITGVPPQTTNRSLYVAD